MLSREEALGHLPSLALGTGGSLCGYPEKADRAHAVAMLKAAIADAKEHDSYIWIDSALHYGAGFSLSCIGEALGEPPYPKAILSFKVGRVLLEPGEAAPPGAILEASPPFDLPDAYRQRQRVFDYSAAGVTKAFAQSFAFLNEHRQEALKPGDLPAIVFVHDPEQGVHKERWGAVMKQVKEEALPALEALRAEGKLQLIGIGTNEVQAALQFVDTPEVDLLMTAGRMTLLAHGAPGSPEAILQDTELTPKLIERAKRSGKALITAAPGNSGLMYDAAQSATAQYYNYSAAAPEVVARAAAIKQVFRAHGEDIQGGVMQFPLLAGAKAVVCGPSSIEEWRQSLAAQARPIGANTWEELRLQGLIDPDLHLGQAPRTGGVIADLVSVASCKFRVK